MRSPARCSSLCTSQSDCDSVETIGACHLCGLVLNPLSPLSLKKKKSNHYIQSFKSKLTFFLYAVSEASQRCGKRERLPLEELRLEGLVSAFHFESAQPRWLLIWEGTGTNKKPQTTDAVSLMKVCKKLQRILLVLFPPAHCWGGKGKGRKGRTDFCC